VKTVYLLLIALCSFSNSVLALDNVELVVVRSEHQLLVIKNGVTLRTFKVAFGSGGKKAKLISGDHTTPKGSYKISKIRGSSRFHLFMQLNYPNMNDAKRALKNKTITRQQYRNILDAHYSGRLPPQNTALGGAIGLHGIGVETQDKIEIHQIADWTQGCIAMRNHEIEELSRYINEGTTISIVD